MIDVDTPHLAITRITCTRIIVVAVYTCVYASSVHTAVDCACVGVVAVDGEVETVALLAYVTSTTGKS